MQDEMTRYTIVCETIPDKLGGGWKANVVGLEYALVGDGETSAEALYNLARMIENCEHYVEHESKAFFMPAYSWGDGSQEEEYEPELGQMVHGQPSQQYECPDEVVNVLRAIATAIELFFGLNPALNTGDKFDSEAFSMHAYSWSDEPQEWNFKWRGIRVSWYKYLGRGTSINKPISKKILKRMFISCMEYLFHQVFFGYADQIFEDCAFPFRKEEEK